MRHAFSLLVRSVGIFLLAADSAALFPPPR